VIGYSGTFEDELNKYMNPARALMVYDLENEFLYATEIEERIGDRRALVGVKNFHVVVDGGMDMLVRWFCDLKRVIKRNVKITWVLDCQSGEHRDLMDKAVKKAGCPLVIGTLEYARGGE